MRRRPTAVRRAVLLAIALAGSPAFADDDGKLRIRLREHYDVSWIDYDGTRERYGGLTNTVNLWWERDLDWAFGLAFNPVLSGGWRNAGRLPSGLAAEDDRVKLLSGGFEGVYYFWTDDPRRGLFARGGLYAAALRRDRAPDPIGGAWLLGLGYEQRVWKIGLIPEVAVRQVLLDRHVGILGVTGSLALKLYFLEPLLAPETCRGRPASEFQGASVPPRTTGNRRGKSP